MIRSDLNFISANMVSTTTPSKTMNDIIFEEVIRSQIRPKGTFNLSGLNALSFLSDPDLYDIYFPIGFTNVNNYYYGDNNFYDIPNDPNSLYFIPYIPEIDIENKIYWHRDWNISEMLQSGKMKCMVFTNESLLNEGTKELDGLEVEILKKFPKSLYGPILKTKEGVLTRVDINLDTYTFDKDKIYLAVQDLTKDPMITEDVKSEIHLNYKSLINNELTDLEGANLNFIKIFTELLFEDPSSEAFREKSKTHPYISFIFNINRNLPFSKNIGNLYDRYEGKKFSSIPQLDKLIKLFVSAFKDKKSFPYNIRYKDEENYYSANEIINKIRETFTTEHLNTLADTQTFTAEEESLKTTLVVNKMIYLVYFYLNILNFKYIKYIGYKLASKGLDFKFYHKPRKSISKYNRNNLLKSTNTFLLDGDTQSINDIMSKDFIYSEYCPILEYKEKYWDNLKSNYYPYDDLTKSKLLQYFIDYNSQINDDYVLRYSSDIDLTEILDNVPVLDSIDIFNSTCEECLQVNDTYLINTLLLSNQTYDTFNIKLAGGKVFTNYKEFMKALFNILNTI